jgi:AraC-like DNA-binding protein
MNKFQVIQPSVLLAPYVKQYWFLTMENVGQGIQRLIPFGCVSLTFQRVQQNDSFINGVLPASCLAGQSTTYTNIVYSGTVNFISVVFQPAGAMAFFKMPMKELNNKNISIDALGDPQIVELEKRLNDMPNNEICVRLIEKFLLKRINQIDEIRHRQLTSVIESINHGQNDVSVLAQDACLSYKQFKRVFTGHIGVNPKDFLRISRFQRVSHKLQIQPQITLLQLADEYGYYDISHLIKEFKEFSGYTPREFMSICDPYSDYHSLFRSTFLDVNG